MEQKVNENLAQLDFGFPRPPQTKTVETLRQAQPNLCARRSHYRPQVETREREDLAFRPRFLSWQSEQSRKQLTKAYVAGVYHGKRSNGKGRK